MQALVASELFSPTRGGTAVWFDHVYRTDEAAGSEIVTARVPECNSFDASYPRRVHRVDWRRNPWLRPESAGIYSRLLSRIAGLARTHRFEAIHAGRVLPSGLVSVLVGKTFELPVVVYAHGEEITGWRERMKRRVMRWTYRQADLVIANSTFTRDRLVELGVAAERVAIVHPGVDDSRFGPHADGGSVRRELGVGSGSLILSVGRLQARKGFDRIIEALPFIAAHKPDTAYAIVGSGDDEGRLRRLAFKCGVADRVHFVGKVTEEELPSWYAACDVFAMPNRNIDGDTEGFGMVYLEAAACGKPVVAGRDGGTGSAVLDGITGLRVDGNRTEAVAAALIRLLSRPDLAETLGRQGQRRALSGFTWREVAGKTKRLHDMITEETDRGRRPVWQPVGVALEG